MAIKKIITAPNAVLTTESDPVESLTGDVQELIQDLKDTLLAQTDPEGVGIAAPQIGVSKRVFIIASDLPESDGDDPAQNNSKERPITVFINPEITWHSKETNVEKMNDEERIMEGCLSIPDIYGPVTRPYEVTIKFRDENWEEQERTYADLESIYVQHEYDHINGILFTEHVLSQGGKLYKVEGEEWEEVKI